jgi:hypothetical protein
MAMTVAPRPSVASELPRRAKERELDAALDAYYGTRTSAELDEERRMVRAFHRSQRRRNLDEQRK